MRRSRLHRALPALLLAAALLTACGDETTSDGSDRKPDAAGASDASAQVNPRTASFAVLDDGLAELALLTQANLGAAFIPDSAPDEEEPEDPQAGSATGCEAEVSFEDRLDPEGLALGDADMDYLLIDDVRLLVVTSAVSSFGDDGTAQAAFDALYEDIGGCTHFEDASEDGSETTVIDLEVDTDPATDDVDDQLDMVGGGAFTLDGQDIPVALGFSAARVGSNVTMVMLVSLGVTEDNELLAPYTEIAVDRLVAVAAGETPEDVAAPMPVSAPPVRLPIEGTPKTLEDFFAAAPGIVGD